MLLAERLIRTSFLPFRQANSVDVAVFPAPVGPSSSTAPFCDSAPDSKARLLIVVLVFDSLLHSCDAILSRGVPWRSSARPCASPNCHVPSYIRSCSFSRTSSWLFDMMWSCGSKVRRPASVV